MNKGPDYKRWFDELQQKSVVVGIDVGRPGGDETVMVAVLTPIQYNDPVFLASFKAAYPGVLIMIQEKMPNGGA